MTDEERFQQGARVKQFDHLSNMLAEIHAALTTLQNRPEFTMNTSRVRTTSRIVIEFGPDKVELNFAYAQVKGWAIQRALEEILNALEKDLNALRKNV